MKKYLRNIFIIYISLTALVCGQGYAKQPSMQQWVKYLEEGKDQKALQVLKSGFNFGQVDSKKRTTLIHAAIHESFDVADYLVKRKVDVNHKDSNGKTALDYANETYDFKLQELLADNGGKISRMPRYERELLNTYKKVIKEVEGMSPTSLDEEVARYKRELKKAMANEILDENPEMALYAESLFSSEDAQKTGRERFVESIMKSSEEFLRENPFPKSRERELQDKRIDELLAKLKKNRETNGSLEEQMDLHSQLLWEYKNY